MPVVPMIEIMSATTADAVSSPPAPGPSSVISRIASPWSITALNGPSTAASGWWRSTSAGCTRTSSFPSTSVADPTSRTVISSSRAARTCSCVMRSIPSNSTSSSVVREPNATVARIAIFAAASAPFTSSVGSGLREAEPLRLGERLRVLGALLHLREDEVRRPVDDARARGGRSSRRATRAAP